MDLGKKHVMWIIELVIWFLVLAVIATGIMNIHFYLKNCFNTYQIFLPDVDGIIAGSPVRMMGIQVGYVNRVKIIGDDVYVKFLITQKNMQLPKGTIATVEFTGLGGSKSLELYPPNELTEQMDKYILVERPKRLHDSLGLLNDMFKKISSISYRITYFCDEFKKTGKTIDVKGKNTSSLDESLNETNKWLNKRQNEHKDLNKKIKEWTK